MAISEKEREGNGRGIKICKLSFLWILGIFIIHVSTSMLAIYEREANPEPDYAILLALYSTIFSGILLAVWSMIKLYRLGKEWVQELKESESYGMN